MSTDPSSLTEAARRGSAAVSAALDAGADLDARDADDWSALDHAAGAGDTEVVRLLLAAGADPTSIGREQRTSYEIALAAGRRDTAALLRTAEEAADQTAADRHRWRPYCRAYQLVALRGFPGWSEETADEPLADDSVVFLHDDLTVTRSIWLDEDVVYTAGDPDWATFCRDELGFTVPDDFDLLA